MAEAAVDILLQTLTEVVISDLRQQQYRGTEVARDMENELEMLIPLLRRIESRSSVADRDVNLNEEIRHVILKAEELVETHRRIQMESTFQIINSMVYKSNTSLTRDLFRIKDEISTCISGLLKSLKDEQRDLVLAPAAEQSVPSYLERCINYFQLFPPNFEVPARRLVGLWVAEGLVHSTKYDNESAEKMAERYLSELIDLKVVVAGKNRSGKLRTCKIDVGMRDQLLRNQTANYLLGMNNEIHRLVDCNASSIGTGSFIRIPNNTQEPHNYRNVVSFLSFSTEEGSKPGEAIGDFLSKCISAGCFGGLRLLDLERVFRPRLPKSIGKLTGLRYLGLRWTYLEHLPNSVNKLFNLQVLDVKRTYISVLPKSIWTMKYLRHLYLSEAYRTRFPNRSSSKITLAALQTLWGAFIDEDTHVENGLDTLINIRKLGLSCRTKASKVNEMAKQLCAIDKWISTLKMLESLRLKSLDESGNAADLHLTSLEGNKNLETVYLLGTIKSQILCELPLRLTDITLSGSELNVDPMKFLGRLPNLVILRLLAKSVVCKYMSCARGGFRCLELLWIWNLENLEELEAEEGSLASLKELEIRSCNQLKKLPDRLSRIENLEIKLTIMQQNFLEETKATYDVTPEYDKDQRYSLRRKVHNGNR